MSNSYKYIDSDYTYIDPKTGVLKNKVGITDFDTLSFIENVAVTKRIQELSNKTLKIKGIKSLFEIHEFLFQDIYSWAGKERKVEITKDGKQFFPTTHFQNAYHYIDILITDYKSISKDNTQKLAKKLADILDNINYLHPFREGNGRAQREFLRLLAKEKGITLNLNPPDNKNIYERYMKGTIESNKKILTELIIELIESNKNNGT